MKPHHTAIWAGVIAAVITGFAAYVIILHPTPNWIYCPGGDDDDLAAFLWATGAYLLTFTATLLLVSDRITGREFQKRDWGRLKALPHR